jgi:hypothetical protein
MWQGVDHRQCCLVRNFVFVTVVTICECLLCEMIGVDLKEQMGVPIFAPVHSSLTSPLRCGKKN